MNLIWSQHCSGALQLLLMDQKESTFRSSHEATTVKKELPCTLTSLQAESDRKDQLMDNEVSSLMKTTLENNPESTRHFKATGRVKRTYPLSSLFTKSVKVLTRQQIDEQTRRFEQDQQRRKSEIEAKAAELDAEAKGQLQSGPALTERTKALCKTISNDPLYVRYEREIEHRKKRLEDKIAQVNKKKQQEEQKQIEEMELYNKKAAEKGSRDYESFFEEMVRWKKHRDDELEVKRASKHDKEVQGATFHPQINERSRKLELKKKRSAPMYLKERDPRSWCLRK